MTNEQRKPYPVRIRFDQPLEPRVREMAEGIRKYHPHIYQQRLLITSASAAAAHVTGSAAAQAGSGHKLLLDGSDAKDTAAGSAVRTCNVWYINTDSQYEIKTTSLSGTSAVTVDNSCMYYITHNAATWGGLYDAEGTIKAQNSTTASLIYGCIAAGTNEINTATFWVAKYWRAMPIWLKIGHGGEVTSAGLLQNGIKLYHVMTATGVEQDQDLRTYEIYYTSIDGQGGAGKPYETKRPWGSPIYGNNTSAVKLELYDQLANTDTGACTFCVSIDWLMWCEKPSSSNLIQVS